MQHKTPAYISTVDRKVFWTQVCLRINISPTSPCWCLDTSLHNCVSCARLPECAVCTYSSSPKGFQPLFTVIVGVITKAGKYSLKLPGAVLVPLSSISCCIKRKCYLQMFLDVIGYLQHVLQMDGFYPLHQEGQGEDRRLDGHAHKCQGVLGHSRTQKHQTHVCFLPLLKRRLSDTDRPLAEPPASPDSKSHSCHYRNRNN